MPIGEQRRDLPGRLKLDPVPLAIIDGQREHAEAGLARQARADHRIEPARQQDHGGFLGIVHNAVPLQSAQRGNLPKKEGPPRKTPERPSVEH